MMLGSIGMIGGLGTSELLIILGITVLVFGASRIPEIAKSFGKGLREFKKATRDVVDDVEAEPKEKKDKS